MSSNAIAPIIIGAAILAVLVAGTLRARHMGYSGLGGNTVVRCRKGHLFTTLWVPGASLKSVRLGFARLQYCPVGRHWTVVTPVRDSELTDEDQRIASEHHDAAVP